MGDLLKGDGINHVACDQLVCCGWKQYSICVESNFIMSFGHLGKDHHLLNVLFLLFIRLQKERRGESTLSCLFINRVA